MVQQTALLANTRQRFRWFSLIAILVNGTAPFLGHPEVLWSLLILGPILAMGFYDMIQKKHTILRNFPVLGHFRFFLESIGPEIHQYFVETQLSGRPFSRDERSLVYQRSKRMLDTRPFGTALNVNEPGYEWVNHSTVPMHLESSDIRVTVGGPDCKQPYSASIFHISAMSFGSLSRNAIRALNGGAKLGNFAHNTGEGGISSYHLEAGGDLIWQIGTAYFGCRTPAGQFDPEAFSEKAHIPSVKMIELKLSQGAKPGHGGILPAAKLTPEIAEIRGVPLGEDVLSPGFHTVFSTPIELCVFIKQLRDLSGGKPIGFKICIGKRREFLAMCKAMVETKITPDFITVDGGEGGTGAAPLEFTHHMGGPLTEGLVFVHNALVGFDLRKKIRIIASGRILSGFDLLSKLCIGADIGASARGMMFSLGCIQALTCHANNCPSGVATQRPDLMQGLVSSEKKHRVHNYHNLTIQSLSEMLGAMGLRYTEELKPWHLMRRKGPFSIQHYGELFSYLKPGDLLQEPYPAEFARATKAARAESFDNPHHYYPI